MVNLKSSSETPTDRRSWRREGGRVVLVGRRCASCSKRSFSASTYCDACHGDHFEPEELGDSGTLYSFSEIHVAPKQFKTPYVVGYVDIDDDVRIFAQIEGSASDLQVGMTVVATVGAVRYDSNGYVHEGYKFRQGVNVND